MSETARLGAAINTIATKYLGNVIAAGDSAGILKWSLRLGDYSTRLAALVAPPLAAAEAADVEPPTLVTLSADPSVALVQLLTAIGLPPEARAGGLITAPAEAILAACSPEQNRELTLLGMFGAPGAFPAADYALFAAYNEQVPGGYESWAPKAAFANTGTWAAYVATK